jgi:hypothetical protein
MAINAFRGQVGNAQVYDTALVRISEAFRKAEDDQGVIIPDAIRLFLRNVVMESLYLHHDNWRRQMRLDPTSGVDAGGIGEQIHNSLIELLRNADAEPWTPGGRPQVTYISVVRYLHNNWCRIFPFCR